MIPETHAESSVFRDAQADCRWMSSDGLLAFGETFRSVTDDPDADRLEAFNAAERLRAVEQELARRERIARLTKGRGTSRDQTYETWVELAAVVKDRLNVSEVLALGGVRVTRTGSSRGRAEHHGPCPLCGGVDRLCAWDGPNGRAWCRQCHWSADAIAVAMTLLPECATFRDAVRHLADVAGTTVPR